MRKTNIAIGIFLCLSVGAIGQNKTYTVRGGENDWAISQKLHISVHQLHVLNPKTNWLRLMSGTKLVVAHASRPIIRPKLPDIAELALLAKEISSKESEGDISVVASTDAPTHSTNSPQSPAIKKAPVLYCARPGDNDWVIAGRVGLTPHHIRALNPSINWNKLSPGTYVRVSGGAIPASRVARGATIRSRYAKVARDSVVIRRGPSAATDKVTVVEAGTAVTVLDKTSGWYKLKFPKGTVGWVRGDMLKAAQRPMIARRERRGRDSYVATNYRSRRHHGSPELIIPNPDKKNRLLAQAFSLRGVPYRYGRSSRKGSDCSGFTSLVYRSQGVSLPRTSRDQSRVGAKISKGQLKAGDLVFFKTNRGTRINHVGIYVGSGKFIHSSSGGHKVQVNSLNEGYYNRRFAGARRVLKGKKATHKKK